MDVEYIAEISAEAVHCIYKDNVNYITDTLIPEKCRDAFNNVNARRPRDVLVPGFTHSVYK